ncbi:MAG TPA: hypothetical protein VFC38_07920 [Stellaceae bacterium]|nr:hypothetical protein [Stellaceae bacterium]
MTFDEERAMEWIRHFNALTLKAANISAAYAKMALQTITILNGGALIALPPFATIAKLVIREHHYLLVKIGLCFVGGLALSTIGVFFAIATTALQTGRVAWARNKVVLKHERNREGADRASIEASIIETETKESTKRFWAAIFRWTSAAFCLFAFSAFIVGVCLTAYLLVHAPSVRATTL